MLDLEYFRAVQAERQRKLAWVSQHGWKYEELRRQRALQRRAMVARVLRAVAARLAPVEGEVVAERSPLAAGS